MDGGIGDGYSSSTTENDIVYKKEGHRRLEDDEDEEEAVEEEEEEEVEEEEEEEEEEEQEEEVLAAEPASKSRNQSIEPPRAVASRDSGGSGDAHFICDNLKSFNVDINLLPQPPAGEPPIVENSARCRRYKLNSDGGEESVAAAILGGEMQNNSNSTTKTTDNIKGNGSSEDGN